ncbi:hypothetical protein AB0L06_16970 [Spirillospora sp. NPDC052269]
MSDRTFVRKGSRCSVLEDAAVTALALRLTRAAELAGERPEDLVAGLSDADLGVLYRGCVRRIRREHDEQAVPRDESLIRSRIR